MKIIKHGEYPEENKVECKECGCKFQYFNSEIQTDCSSYEDYEIFGIFATYKYLTCPECRNRIEIFRNIEYEHRSGLIAKIKKIFKKEDKQ